MDRKQSSFTHPYVIPNLYDVVEHKTRYFYFEEMLVTNRFAYH